MSFLNKNNIVWLSTCRALEIVFQSVSMLLISRYLGPESRGIYAVTIFLISLITVFGSLSLHAACINFISRDKSNANSFYLIIIVYSLIFAGFLYVAQPLIRMLIIGHFSGISEGMLSMVMIISTLEMINLLFYNLIIGLGWSSLSAKIQLVYSVFLSIAGIICLPILQLQIEHYLFIWSIICLATTFLYCLLLSQNGVLPEKSHAYEIFNNSIRYSIPFYFNNIVQILSRRASVLIISIMLGNYAAGLFSVATMIQGYIMLIPVYVALETFRNVSSKTGYTAYSIIEVGEKVMLIPFILFVVYIFFGKFLIVSLLGEDFSESYWILLGLFPSIFLETHYNIMVMELAKEKLPLWIPFSYLLGFILQIIILINSLKYSLVLSISLSYGISILCLYISAAILFSMKTGVAPIRIISEKFKMVRLLKT